MSAGVRRFYTNLITFFLKSILLLPVGDSLYCKPRLLQYLNPGFSREFLVFHLSRPS